MLCLSQAYTRPTACWAQVLWHCKDSEDPVTQAVALASEISHSQMSKLQQQLNSQQQECSNLRQEVHSLQVRTSRL